MAPKAKELASIFTGAKRKLRRKIRAVFALMALWETTLVAERFAPLSKATGSPFAAHYWPHKHLQLGLPMGSQPQFQSHRGRLPTTAHHWAVIFQNATQKGKQDKPTNPNALRKAVNDFCRDSRYRLLSTTGVNDASATMGC